jgi:aquaporin Z
MARRATGLHVPEYLIEAGALGAFMISAAAFATALYYPPSPVHHVLHDEWIRRAVMGLGMGLTAGLIIYSPWGQRSGAHMNPAVTLTFFRLGKVARIDAAGYVVAQFTGALTGIAAAAGILDGMVSAPSVNYVTTVPGPAGTPVAFVAEAVISFVLMFTVLTVSNHRRWAPFTGVCAGILVCVYVTFEAPLSGMSMNPARTLGSALLAREFTSLWIYFVAPPLGMLSAAELFVRRAGVQGVLCAKLHHRHDRPCIFGCGLKPSGPTGIEAA